MNRMNLGRNLPNVWMRYCDRLLTACAVFMAGAGAYKLALEFYRLTWDPGWHGAIDLRNLHLWVTSWFASQPIFQQIDAAMYPPATYALLWPLLGWMSLGAARWFWAVTSIGALAAIIVLIWRISTAETRRDKIFIALLLLSINGTGVCIGNGQLILHVLATFLAGVFLLERKTDTFATDLIAAALLAWSMVKPNVAAPFLWVLLFAWERRRPVFLMLLLYAILTVTAAAFQKDHLFALFERCLTKASEATSQFPGTRNIHSLLVAFGGQKWIVLSSILMFAALGIWTYRHRSGDKWVLIAVAALIARLWTYHRLYDDVLILLPEIALFRIAKRESSSVRGAVAGVLLVLMAMAMLCPTRFLNQPTEWAWTSDWTCVFGVTHDILWLCVLGYLVIYTQRGGHTASEVNDRSGS
jgi:glycosyl transferase family 87